MAPAVLAFSASPQITKKQRGSKPRGSYASFAWAAWHPLSTLEGTSSPPCSLGLPWPQAPGAVCLPGLAWLLHGWPILFLAAGLSNVDFTPLPPFLGGLQAIGPHDEKKKKRGGGLVYHKSEIANPLAIISFTKKKTKPEGLGLPHL